MGQGPLANFLWKRVEKGRKLGKEMRFFTPEKAGKGRKRPEIGVAYVKHLPVSGPWRDPTVDNAESFRRPEHSTHRNSPKKAEKGRNIGQIESSVFGNEKGWLFVCKYSLAR